MKPVKMAGLAALLALAGVAVVVITGIGVASADEEGGDTEIVLCKVELVLCEPASKVWEGGKGITGTAISKVQFLGAFTVECSSVIKGEAVEEMETELTYRITERELSGCTAGEESACPGFKAQYENLTSAKFTVAAGDVYSLVLTDPRVKIECGKLFSCIYAPEAEKVVLPIDNPTNTGKPLVLVKEVQLPFFEGSLKFCEKKVVWDATYELVGGMLSIRLSLFKL